MITRWTSTHTKESLRSHLDFNSVTTCSYIIYLYVPVICKEDLYCKHCLFKAVKEIVASKDRRLKVGTNLLLFLTYHWRNILTKHAENDMSKQTPARPGLCHWHLCSGDSGYTRGQGEYQLKLKSCYMLPFGVNSKGTSFWHPKHIGNACFSLRPCLTYQDL